MLKKNISFYLCLLVFAGCSTKVDLNTEWKDITVVYGLLDQNDEYHYVKINKAFLGDGDYYQYAMIRDSSEYKSVNAYIEELSGSTVVATHQLRDTVLSNRLTNGVFYSPEQTLYYFRKTGLSASHKYRLVAKLNEGASNEKEVTGETELINNFSAPSMLSIAVGTYDVTTGHSFLKPHVKFFPPSNSDTYEIIWRLKWDEYTPTDTINKYYDWSLGTVERSAISSSGQVDFEVSGEGFYITLKNVIDANDPNVTRRVFRSVNVMVYAASDDLATYISVNKPQSGLVQERPEFTNISNGLGLFSSRLHVTTANRPLSLGSYRELVYGPHTSGLLFCSDTTSPAYAIPPSVICP